MGAGASVAAGVGVEVGSGVAVADGVRVGTGVVSGVGIATGVRVTMEGGSNVGEGVGVALAQPTPKSRMKAPINRPMPIGLCYTIPRALYSRASAKWAAVIARPRPGLQWSGSALVPGERLARRYATAA